MENFLKLSCMEKNVLLASIIGDGEITKIYNGSRRKNRSYREHYGVFQQGYREWKCTTLPNIFYLTTASHSVRSKSMPLFNELYPHFYDEEGNKHLPIHLLKYCTEEIFLAVLYLDDGSICISKRINHNKKKIYLSPVISFYLQCYSPDELIILADHIKRNFNFHCKLAKRKDGKGYILKLMKTSDVYSFLNMVKRNVSIESLKYKYDWEYRVQTEQEQSEEGYEVISSSSNRNAPYQREEIQAMLMLKKQGVTDKEIAEKLGRSYWSIVYKLADLRKKNN